MLKHAIILAAGCGSRLRPLLADALPKGAFELDGIPIVEQSVQRLIAAGIEHIYIGTGHGQYWYQELAKRYPQITCIHNSIYADSGSMHTLSLVAKKCTQDILIVESDLIFEQRALACFNDFWI